MNKLKTIFCCISIEVLLIACVAFANRRPAPLHYFLWYNLLYGMVCSFLLPLYLLRGKKNVFRFTGLIVPGKRQAVIWFLFVAFSVAGQLIPMAAAGKVIPWHLLPTGIVPLVMTTFFEEFLFRGFFQNIFDKSFGPLPAILVSGLTFSLYHLGYPGFRTTGDILLLFAVGIMFAAAYKLSGNNLIVACFVNLPNAFITYILKYEQFPVMTAASTIACSITLCMTAAVFIVIAASGKAARDSGSASTT